MPVVAAIDQSERSESVITQANRLAEDAGVDLHVVHVGTVGAPRVEGGYDPDRDREKSRREARKTARTIAEDVDGVDEFQPVGLDGDPAEAILEHCAERGAEYIVVSARKRSPMGQAVFGSVTQSLLLNTDVPVVATPHHPDDGTAADAR